MEARAIQWTVRQSARKMRLVIDQIRGRSVPEAYGILRFSKKHAAKQIHKVLRSAVANAEQRALRDNVPLDVDGLRVGYAVVNEGPTLKRFTSAAMGRATPIKKRTSHVEIHVSAPDAPAARPAVPPAKAKEPKGAGGKQAKAEPVEAKARATKGTKGTAAGKRTKTGTKPRRRSD
jgi:large subunit ribosomal protein L22